MGQRGSRRSVLNFFFKLNFACCVTYLPIIRPYLYSLLPESTIKSERIILDTLYVAVNTRTFFWKYLVRISAVSPFKTRSICGVLILLMANICMVP
jgi:hypothetical protein